MTGPLTIRFASDMPTATVEVVSPDLEIVARLMIEPGRAKTVQVPSERSFLRVHLPSGRIVTLKDPGSLTREISLQTIPLSVSKMSRYDLRDLQAPARAGVGDSQALPLGNYGSAELIELTQTPERRPGMVTSEGEAEWRLPRYPQQHPLMLKIHEQSGMRLEVLVPGNASRVWARADQVRDRPEIAFRVQLETIEASADTIMSYLQRGDFYSAEAMVEWIREAGGLLFDKIEDPYAAAVGAYLLLRIRKFDQMHDWAHNLADWFGFLPDGCVIWAWQLIHQRPSYKEDIRRYLLMSVERGVPVYSEGLRLLTDGLRLMGADGERALDKVIKSTGVVLWSCPVSTSLYSLGLLPAASATLHDVAFASRA